VSRSRQQRFEQARHDPTLVVLEGAHALKHAVRFGADVVEVCSPDPAAFHRLLADLAPDVTVPVAVDHVDPDVWEVMTRGGLPSPALAVARRPAVDLAGILTPVTDRPIVLLDAPTHLGNVGAAVRVAAAAGAAALVVVGAADPWHPRAVRAGAGLQFALPVARLDDLGPTHRPVVAMDADGTAIDRVDIPRGAVFTFGSERRGLSPALRARAALTVALPMRRGVSSLNLATAVAATLYGWGG
jgi:TrmH family RNA methyltransferase